MVSDKRLSDIEKRIAGVGNASVRAATDPSGRPRVVANIGGHEVEIRVMRDLSQATDDDTVFVGHAFSDVQQLLKAVSTGRPLSADVEAGIAQRLAAASPGPWTAFIESDGGQAGCDVIRISERDDEPDMYLWIGEELAPSEIFRFVAAARQDVPELLAAARSLRG